MQIGRDSLINYNLAVSNFVKSVPHFSYIPTKCLFVHSIYLPACDKPFLPTHYPMNKTHTTHQLSHYYHSYLLTNTKYRRPPPLSHRNTPTLPRYTHLEAHPNFHENDTRAQPRLLLLLIGGHDIQNKRNFVSVKTG